MKNASIALGNTALLYKSRDSFFVTSFYGTRKDYQYYSFCGSFFSPRRLIPRQTRKVARNLTFAHPESQLVFRWFFDPDTKTMMYSIHPRNTGFDMRTSRPKKSGTQSRFVLGKSLYSVPRLKFLPLLESKTVHVFSMPFFVCLNILERKIYK